MAASLTHRDITLEPDDGERLANLSGPFDEHLRQLELRLGVEIANRGNQFRVSGAEMSVGKVKSNSPVVKARMRVERFSMILMSMPSRYGLPFLK